MSSTEDYLDSLLRSVMEPSTPPAPKPEPVSVPQPEKIVITEEPVTEEPVIEEPVVEEPIIEEPVYEEPEAEAPVLEVPEFDESMFEEPKAEAPVLEAPEFDESMFTEPEAEAPVLEEPAIEEPVEDEDIANLLKSIGEMNSPFEESETTDNMDFSVGEETTDISEMLDSMSKSDSTESYDMPEMFDIPDDFQVPEESEINVDAAETNFDEMNLDDLLAGMEPGSELSEIDALLNMDSQNVAVDESVLDTEEPVDINSFEEEEQEEGRKKRKKKDKKPFKFKLKKDKKKSEESTENPVDENDDDIEISLVGEEAEEQTEVTPPKKAGFFSNIFDTLTKEVEDEPEKKVFEESAVDFAQETAAENQKLLEESDDEGEEKEGKKGKKGKKEKKPKEKKTKKKKEKSPEDLIEENSYRKLPLKKIIVICVLCFSLGIVITLVTYLIPYYRDSEAAQAAYDHGNYAETYTSLKGHNLNKKQQELYNKSLVIMKVKRKLDSYENYMQMNMPAQALDALLQGLKNAQEYQSYASELGVADQFSAYANRLEEEVTTSFGLDLQQAYAWAQIEDPQEYSRNIYQYLVKKSGIAPNGQLVPTDFSENAVIAGEEEEFAE